MYNNGDIRLLAYGVENNAGTLSALTTCVILQTASRDGTQRSLRHYFKFP